ncbi:MAG TPA: hypothetical protein VL693_19090 [Vicinamibacterales bacterium]|jgi:hypothetical protein|nr:hypothetical protein [Vicinamibacterales bacterium]
MSRRARFWVAAPGAFLALGVFAYSQLHAVAAGALLHPARTQVLWSVVRPVAHCGREAWRDIEQWIDQLPGISMENHERRTNG